jgi:hypothetical protein
MLLIMALEDAQHQRPNLQYISAQPTPPDVSTLPDAKWLRDLLPVVDPKVYQQIRALVNGSIAVPGGLVDGQLIDDTAKTSAWFSVDYRRAITLPTQPPQVTD